MKILGIASSHLIINYYEISKKEKVPLIFTNLRMEKSINNIFPEARIIKLFPIHLSQKKINIFTTLIKNIFKIIFNYLKILLAIYFNKNNYKEIYYSHNYSLEMNQVIKICKKIGIKVIFMPAYNITKNKKIKIKGSYNNIYKILFMNELILIDDDRLGGDHVQFKFKPDKIINNYKNFNEDYYDEFLLKYFKKNFNFNILDNFNTALIVDADLLRIQQHYGEIDLDLTIKNFQKFYNAQLKKYDFLFFKKRIDQYGKNEIYFYDLISGKGNLKLIDNFFPIEIFLKKFENIYSVFSYTIDKKEKAIQLNHLVKFKNKSKWLNDNFNNQN